jgi:hypothetical protein
VENKRLLDIGHEDGKFEMNNEQAQIIQEKKHMTTLHAGKQ